MGLLSQGTPAARDCAFERAASKAPNNPVYHYHLGLAQLKQGNDVQGRAALKRALALKPDFNGAEEARKALEETKQASGHSPRN